MTLEDSTLGSTGKYIGALITDQCVTFHLDHPDNKDFVNQTAGMRQLCSFSAQGLTHSTTFFTPAQPRMQRSEQKSQLWARRN